MKKYYFRSRVLFIVCLGMLLLAGVMIWNQPRLGFMNWYYDAYIAELVPNKFCTAKRPLPTAWPLIKE